ncbi:rod shape-determining protein MreC [Borreliella burgdorferi]|uniref:rod shape-determining protein MreC n=1 Tax=Borreliella burgdorferi TaxID=139 RepID=UPI00017F37B5|nr:rod shape-determining protein MreC [Borreliella burgdorferi]MCD2373992.1 rod shape-determining protein MreC [Borreliella burgdorferi]MCD2383197.1 rod shape-determining protein MreC [Borreliella burgdorferi]MCD2384161.1 rod shape-determining protein MreC [Borreliella burgdorferi]MCD2389354.1 rod shape-determining protein MreC [Borreliella burgdorferi]MCD2393030.1 rod shape-determining protein MreC [Borreliella burgdorferi]
MNFIVKFKNFIKVLLVLIVSLVFMIYDSSSIQKRRSDNFLFFTLNSYIQSRMHGVFSFISNVFKTVNEYKNYKDKIEFYKKRIQQLEIVTQNIQSLRQENVRLKEQLNFYSSSPSDFISAEIIYLNYSNISTLMAINKGFNDGIEKDMIAVAYQDGFSGLVGKVVKVYSNTAKILPLTNYENFVSARIQSSRFIGLIEGNGYGKKLEMNYVNRLAEKDLKIGDSIVTAGFSEYPVGIYIGKITNFHILDYNSLLKIEVEPAIVLDKLEYVFLVKNNKETGE